MYNEMSDAFQGFPGVYELLLNGSRFSFGRKTVSTYCDHGCRVRHLILF
ncbi:hypothetical protein MGWOODY_Mmi1593 [hydrothermal vent metagenome]|uniref:Uncharacterized protein n=1 Tax=hydrothermal vent metagenome TaxID=652676 RepID=A0A160VDG1_9ZZZZ